MGERTAQRTRHAAPDCPPVLVRRKCRQLGSVCAGDHAKPVCRRRALGAQSPIRRLRRIQSLRASRLPGPPIDRNCCRAGASDMDTSRQRRRFAHHTYDAFWEAMNTESQAARVDVPAVYVGGWYDVFLQGTINSFVHVQAHGGPHARGQCRLIIGPWIHDDSERLSRRARSANCHAPPIRFVSWITG